MTRTPKARKLTPGEVPRALSTLTVWREIMDSELFNRDFPNAERLLTLLQEVTSFTRFYFGEEVLSHDRNTPERIVGHTITDSSSSKTAFRTFGSGQSYQVTQKGDKELVSSRIRQVRPPRIIDPTMVESDLVRDSMHLIYEVLDACKEICKNAKALNEQKALKRLLYADIGNDARKHTSYPSRGRNSNAQIGYLSRQLKKARKRSRRQDAHR